MSSIKKTTVSLNDSLVPDFDPIILNSNSDELFEKATTLYLKQNIHERMQEGYLEMATINLTISSEAFAAEAEAGEAIYQSVSGV